MSDVPGDLSSPERIAVSDHREPSAHCPYRPRCPCAPLVLDNRGVVVRVARLLIHRGVHRAEGSFVSTRQTALATNGRTEIFPRWPRSVSSAARRAAEMSASSMTLKCTAWLTLSRRRLAIVRRTPRNGTRSVASPAGMDGTSRRRGRRRRGTQVGEGILDRTRAGFDALHRRWAGLARPSCPLRPGPRTSSP